MQIIVTGSLAYDRIMEFPEKFSDHLLPDKLYEINVCFMVDGMTENFGGTAGNIAYALKLMGGNPQISATLGLDSQRYLDWLDTNGISSSRIHLLKDDWTAGAYITTDKDNNQITNFNPGAMRQSSALDFSTLEEDALLIISPGNLDDMADYPRTCREKGLRYIFDPGQAMPMLHKDELLESIDGCMLLMVNDYEMNLILKKTERPQEEILERAGATVITLGDEGSLLYKGRNSTPIPLTPARQTTDPTGAGDAYRGGLLSGLADGRSLEHSCLLGSVCASFAVEHYGTQVYSFTQEEFDHRLDLLAIDGEKA